MSEIVLSGVGTPRSFIPLFVGHQACPSGHSFGPFVREHYLIHFCLHGCGTLKNRYGEHAVHAGQLFVIRPNELTTYTADLQDPWEYVWIAFDGKSAAVFDKEPSVYDTPSGVDVRFTELIKDNVLSPEIYISVLFELTYFLFCEPSKSKSGDMLHQIKRYIQYNYMLPLTVAGLAKSFGFERSHLSRAFKQHYDIGVKEYIIEVRMQHAHTFLARGCAVNECAHLVGYDDEFNFSKTFKKHFGIPPSTLVKAAKHPDLPNFSAP